MKEKQKSHEKLADTKKKKEKHMNGINEKVGKNKFVDEVNRSQSEQSKKFFCENSITVEGNK